MPPPELRQKSNIDKNARLQRQYPSWYFKILIVTSVTESFYKSADSIREWRCGMKRLQKFVFAVVAIISIFIYNNSFATCTGSSPDWASTADYNSVRSCVCKASMGDSITISGNATWAKTLTLTRGVTLIGSGSPTITSAVTVFYWKPSPEAQAAQDKLSISGFVFNGNGSNFSGHGPIRVFNSSGSNYANLIDKNNTISNTSPSGRELDLAALLYAIAASKSR
jgi:hypothetical protein